MNQQTNFQTEVINGKEFLKICPSESVYEGKGKQIRLSDDDDEQVAIFRINGVLYCLWNICPHRHQDQIHNGIIKNMKVTCPAHGWTYDIQTGKNINPKQGMRSLDSFEIFEKDGFIFIEKPLIKIPKWRSDNHSQMDNIENEPQI